MIPLAELLPDEDFRFHLTLRRGDVRTFFAPSPDASRVVAERRQWIQREPHRYVAATPAGLPLVAEWARQVREWGLAQGQTCAALGAELEPDFLLLAPDATDGNFRLEAGALVFPTSWALEEKLGRTMEEIHGIVPGLNSALGPPISQFLRRLKPQRPGFLRSNWGLAATAQLNLHPAQPRPPLSPPLRPDTVWLRVEHQILAALPSGAGIVFGIRIALHPLRTLLANPALRSGLHRALRTMPADLAAYKGLAAVQEELVQLTAGAN